MALLMDQSRSILLLWTAKAQDFGELWLEKCTQEPFTYPEPNLFDRDKLEDYLALIMSIRIVL